MPLGPCLSHLQLCIKPNLQLIITRLSYCFCCRILPRNLLKMKKFPWVMQQANSQSHLHVMLIDTAMIPVSSMLICDRWRSRTFRGCLWLELADYDHIRFTTALQVRTVSRTCTSWYATVATMNAFLCTSKQHKRRQVRRLFAPNWDEGWPNHHCHLRPVYGKIDLLVWQWSGA